MLGTAVALVVIAVIITLAAATIAAGEQKSSANLVRTQQASAAADSGMERGLIYLRQNLRQVKSTAAGGWMNTSAVKWSACTGSTVTVPCGDGSQNLYDNRWTAYSTVPNLKATAETLPDGFVSHFLAQSASPGANTPVAGIFQAVSAGTTEDGKGKALIRQNVLFQPFLAHRPDAPLIASGTIGLSGTITIVTNPNGGGMGVPLSVWSKENITETGSMQTCHIYEYLSTNSTTTTQTNDSGDTLTLCPACICPNTADQTLSRTNVEGIDVLDVDSNVGANPDSPYFPPDLFEYTFGVPEAQWQSIKDQAQLVTDCSTLSAASSGLIWVEGNCSIPSNSIVGTFAAPVILVVSNGNFTMNANGQFLGVLFAFAHDGGAVDVKLTGGPTLYGSMISNRNIDTGNGTFTARYDKAVLDNLANGFSAASRMALVPGSWRDY